METWFLNHVLGLSLLVLHLGLPGPLGAGTPGNNSTDPVTAGLHYSAATDELGPGGNNATSASYSSEASSPSQRSVPLRRAADTHAAAAAGSFGTEQTHSITETSTLETKTPLATEPLTSNFVTTTEASSRSSTRFTSSTSRSNTSSSTSGTSRSNISSSTSGGSSGTSRSITSSTSRSSTSSNVSSSTSGGSSGTSRSSTSSTSSTSRSSTSITSSTSRSNISSNVSSSTSGGSSGTSRSSTSSTSSTSRSSTSITSSTSRSNISSNVSSSTSSGSSGTSSRSSRSSSTSSSSSGTSSSTSSGSSGTSSSISSSRSSRDWKDFTNTEQMPGFSHVSEEDRTWVFTEASMHQDGSDTALRMRDATASMSHTGTLTDSTYTTTISRAGERTLLSVTSSSSNSTSSAFTEDSNPHQPPSTWGIPSKPAETEDYTHSGPSTRINGRETTDQHVTDPFKGGSEGTETGSSVGYRGTQSFTGQPNATEHQRTSTSEGTSDSTPPLRVTEPSTDQSEVSFSSTPPFTSPAGGPTNISGTEHGLGSSSGASTVFSAGDHSTSTQGGTEELASKTTEESVDLGLTAVPSTVSSSTSEMNQSLTDMPPVVTNVFLTTSPVTVTERSQITEEEPTKSTAFSTTITTPTTTSTMAIITPPLAPTSPPVLTSTTTSSPPQSSATATVPYGLSSTVASTPAVQPTQQVPPSHTQGPVTGMANPTNVTPLQTEASTGTLRVTTAHGQAVSTTHSHSTPTKSTEALHTTGKQTDRGPTELVVTTAPPDVQRTSAPPPPPKLLRNPCVSNPCNNGGMCVSNRAGEFSCSCQQGWTGQTCSQDIDECKQDSCPAGSRCINTEGSFRCECPLGFDLEDGRTCTRAKTFLGTFNGNKLPQNADIQREIIKLLNVSLSVLRGYRCSTLTKKEDDGVRIMAVNMFSISADVMTAEVNNSIQTSLSNCNSSLAHCRVVLQYKLTYRVESLCMAQKTQCDTERSSCTDSSGTAYCQCRDGYYKHNPDDLSCLECGDGYKLENGTCVPCMFGFGGFNCGNFYKLIAVVVSPAGGALLLILIIALIVTCCKRDKNDINKIIFKSGDLQMSPYADFPKNNRISMEWGRETIEMQENGSTKNLLQMTDIYYSPALRNSDLERNGLYPFPGLPGSRHSCIYPAQWNPSFISDDSRRRDYF